MVSPSSAQAFHKTALLPLLDAFSRQVASSTSSRWSAIDELAEALAGELGRDTLHELAEELSDLSDALRHASSPLTWAPATTPAVVEETRRGASLFRLEGRRCGKPNCKCATGKMHGPYWYRYFRTDGRVRKEYIGKTLSGVPADERPRMQG